MHALSISLLAVLLLTLAGCGEKATDNKTEAAASAAQTKELHPWDPGWAPKELTQEEKFAETKKKAEAGDAQAQYNLGVMYYSGEGVPKDATKAVEWFEKAATQGYAAAQLTLGWMFAKGNGVPKDAVKAIEWWEKAAAQGDVGAQNNLGRMYKYGKGVPKNHTKAFEWYKKTADQGNAEAQVQLGLMYATGKGVSKNSAMAVEWWTKAAVQGDADAQLNLGLAYDAGDGVPKDSTKAVEWYQKAAAKGNAGAQTNLGWAYKSGVGVIQNDVLAYTWSNLAAAQGNKTALKNRDIYEAQLTPAQRAEGQRLASNWKKGDTLLASSDGTSGSTSPDGKPTKQGTGTAFVVSSEGHALTNYHVINGCTEVKVAGREGVAKVITSDSVNDLALLQLPGKTKDVALLNADPGKLRQGEDIIVFGYPLNFVLSSGGNLTPGTISALTGLGNNTNQIQITAAIQPGSSGSPVMDKKANVVGVYAPIKY